MSIWSDMGRTRSHEAPKANILLEGIAHLMLAITLSLSVLNPSAIFHVENMNQISKFTLLVSAICFLITRKVFWARLFVLALIASATLAAAVFTENADFSSDRYLRSLISFLAPWLFLCFLPTREDIARLVIYVALMPLGAALWGYALQAGGFWQVWSGLDGGFLRFQGSTIPAFMTGICTSGTFAAMILFVYRAKWSAILLPINFALLILSGGRMGIAVTLILIVVTIGLRVKIRFTTVVGGVVVAISGLAFVIFLAPSTIERFMESSLSGREFIWDYLLAVIDQYPYAGIGLGHQPTIVPPWLALWTGTTAAHNEYLRLRLELGVFAYYAVLSLLVCLIMMVWFRPGGFRDPMILLAASAFFIFAMTDNSFSNFEQILIVPLAYFEGVNRMSKIRSNGVVSRRAPRIAGKA